MNVEKELAALQMSTGELRKRHAEVFGEQPRSRHKKYLIRRIAWRLQAKAEGDLSERALRRAEELAVDADVRTTAPRNISTSTRGFLPPAPESDMRDHRAQAAFVTDYATSLICFKVTETQKVWRLEHIKSQMGSGVLHDRHLYTLGQDGIAACIDVQTGETVWEKRLRGRGEQGGSWSSMLLADGRIYIPNQSGDVFVLRASPSFELLATNSVEESTNASLAASAGGLFLRTDVGLSCIANNKLPQYHAE